MKFLRPTVGKIQRLVTFETNVVQLTLGQLSVTNWPEAFCHWTIQSVCQVAIGVICMTLVYTTLSMQNVEIVGVHNSWLVLCGSRRQFYSSPSICELLCLYFVIYNWLFSLRVFGTTEHTNCWLVFPNLVDWAARVSLTSCSCCLISADTSRTRSTKRLFF